MIVDDLPCEPQGVLVCDSPCSPGLIRFWDTSAGRMVSESNFFEGACPPAFTSLQYCRQLGVLVVVTYDHTLILYSIKERRKVKQVRRVVLRATSTFYTEVFSFSLWVTLTRC